MNKTNLAKSIAYVLVVAGVFLLLFSVIIPKAEPIFGPIQTTKKDSNLKEVIHYVAIGDSLTEGIGDTTDLGGFVPIAAQAISDQFQLNGIEVDNFGKSGDRSDQILKRIKKNAEIQDALETADIISITVGGNDLMKALKVDMLNNVTVDMFNKPMKTYQKQLQNIFNEIRTYNQTAPIYVLGIYNPFYLYFPEITEMQTIVDNWNDATEEIVDQEELGHFIPINNLLYKGIDGDVGVTGDDANSTNSGSSTSDDITNDALFEEDHFHPNNLGYQLMAGAFRDEVIRTQDEWLYKSGSGRSNE